MINKRTVTMETLMKTAMSPALLAGAIAALLGGTAAAQVHPERPTYDYEKCYGVARAAQNDCFTPRNSCAGTSATDRQPDAWIYLPAGSCEKLLGGSLEPGKPS